jgi:hypothetical protein
MGEPLLIRYWFSRPNLYHGGRGYGVTAFSLDDAVNIIRANGFAIPENLEGVQVQENVTFDDLSKNDQAEFIIPHVGPMAA